MPTDNPAKQFMQMYAESLKKIQDSYIEPNSLAVNFRYEKTLLKTIYDALQALASNKPFVPGKAYGISSYSFASDPHKALEQIFLAEFEQSGSRFDQFLQQMQKAPQLQRDPKLSQAIEDLTQLARHMNLYLTNQPINLEKNQSLKKRVSCTLV